MFELPTALLQRIRDSEIEVVHWEPARAEMILRASKEIGPVVGTLRLTGVDFVSMRPAFTVVALATYDGPFPDYLRLELDEGQTAIALQEAWGKVYCVVAEGINYEENRAAKT
jgi:hypothetical protein